MARKPKSPRIFLRSRKDGPSVWTIRHGYRMISTGFGEDEKDKAMSVLEDYAANLSLTPDPEFYYQVNASPGFVYFLSCEWPDFPIKIGWASDVALRVRKLQGAMPYKITVLGMFPGTIDDERRLHIGYAEYRLEGEWFSRSDKLMALVSEAAYRDWINQEAERVNRQ